MMLRLGLCAVTAALLIWAALPAHAHDSRPLLVELQQLNDTRLMVRSTAPPSLDAANRPELSFGAPCIALQDTQANGPAQFECPQGITGVQLFINYPFYNPSLSTLIRVRFENGETKSDIVEPAQSTWIVPARESFTGVAKSYFEIGFRHIVGGIDHLLFLAGLIYIARTPRRIMVTVTGFTLAHSITIFLTALGIIRVSVPAVETIIALSIVVLAGEIARNNRDSLTWRRPIVVAAGFGLVHGAGFAAALSEIGLPQTETISALLFFNIGVEAGQFAIIGAILAIGWGLNKLPLRSLTNLDAPRIRNAYGYGLGIVSALWFFERLWGAVTL